MIVLISYKDSKEDGSYEIKSHIERFCDGIVAPGGNEVILLDNDSKTQTYYNVIYFTILNDV